MEGVLGEDLLWLSLAIRLFIRYSIAMTYYFKNFFLRNNVYLYNKGWREY